MIKSVEINDQITKPKSKKKVRFTLPEPEKDMFGNIEVVHAQAIKPYIFAVKVNSENRYYLGELDYDYEEDEYERRRGTGMRHNISLLGKEPSCCLDKYPPFSYIDNKLHKKSPAKSCIIYESVCMIPCAPCCIRYPSLRPCICCLQASSRVVVGLPTLSLLGILLVPFTMITCVYDCFQNESHKCIGDDVPAESVLLSYLLCAPYNQSLMYGKWQEISQDERKFFAQTVGKETMPYFCC